MIISIMDKSKTILFLASFLLSACTQLQLQPAVGADCPTVKTECDNWSDSLEGCLPKAEKGDKNAQFHVGQLYEAGRGTAKNYSEALKWYRRAAEQGNVEAEFYLGRMYQNGLGVKEDDAEAQKWFTKAFANAPHKDIYKTDSFLLPAIITGLGRGFPFYEFSFINESEESHPKYNAAFKERLNKTYPPGTRENQVINALKKQGFKLIEDKYKNGATGFTDKTLTVYAYAHSIGNLVMIWSIAWRVDQRGKITEIDGRVTTGIS